MADPQITGIFNEIYESTYKLALQYVLAKCGTLADIKDILQEIYLELYLILQKKGSGYIKKPDKFVLKLAKCKVYRHYTLAQRLNRMLPLSISDMQEEELPAEEESIGLEERAVERELLDTVRTYLNAKPELTRKIFYLYYSMELTIPEIAALLKVKESFVKNRLYRTLGEIRGFYLEQEGG